MSEPTGVRERRVLAATSLGHCLTHLYMLVFPALLTPLRAELGLRIDEALSLSVGGYLLYGLGALPAGYVADRWSARWMLCLSLGIEGAGAISAGLSRSPAQLFCALALLGLGASIYHPTGMALISRAFTERRGWALGKNGVWGNVGLACAPFAAGLLAALLGWRWAYLVLAVPGLAAAAWVASAPLEPPRAVPPSPSAPAESGARVPLARYFALSCLAMTIGGLALQAGSVVMPSYFEERASFLVPWTSRVLALLGATGAKTTAATMLTSLVYVVGIVGQMVGGRLADGRDLRLAYLGFHLATLLPLVGMAMLTEGPLVVAAMAYVVFGLGMQPAENSLVARLTPARWRSTAYGLKFVLTFGVGSFAATLAGSVAHRHGLGAVYATVAGLEVALAVVVMVLWLVSRHKLPRVAND